MAALHDWDLAPCGLLEIDAGRTITRANSRFRARTGYSAADIAAGLSWTDLLTPAGRIFYETQLAPMLALNGAVEEILIELIRSDGLRLPVLMTAELHAGADNVLGLTRIALMTVPDRQQYEQQLRAARREAEVANEANLEVRRRLELLAAANTALASSLDVTAALRNLARVLAGDLADWCLVYVADPEHPRELPHWAAAHRDPGRQSEVDRLAPLLAAHTSEQSTLRRVLAGAGPLLVADAELELLRSATTSREVLDLLIGLDLRSTLVVPSTARAQQAAVIVLARTSTSARYTDDDLEEMTDLGERTGIAIDNLRLYAREHSMSVSLQKALLTALPQHDRLELASRYEPGLNGNEVGGDWYDAFRQPDGTTVVVVGDVVGHDIQAAAAMGHLRGVLRTIGYTASSGPARTLARADRAALGLRVQVLASAVVASLTERAAGEFTLHWSSAGHPPPLVIRRGGGVEVLSGPPDMLLGVLPDRRRHQFETVLHAGDTVLLYTDGLVERRDEDLMVSICGLADKLAGSADRTVDDVCELALRGRPPQNNDDAVVLAVRVRTGR